MGHVALGGEQASRVTSPVPLHMQEWKLSHNPPRGRIRPRELSAVSHSHPSSTFLRDLLCSGPWDSPGSWHTSARANHVARGTQTAVWARPRSALAALCVAMTFSQPRGAWDRGEAPRDARHSSTSPQRGRPRAPASCTWIELIPARTIVSMSVFVLRDWEKHGRFSQETPAAHSQHFRSVSGKALPRSLRRARDRR